MSVTISNWLFYRGRTLPRGPAESAASNGKRYDWVKKKFLSTDAPRSNEGDRRLHRLQHRGYLCTGRGRWDTFETKADYLDKFASATVKIVSNRRVERQRRNIFCARLVSRSGTLNYAPSSMVDNDYSPISKRAD